MSLLFSLLFAHQRYNLLNSCLMDFFLLIKNGRLAFLMEWIITQQGEKLDHISYVSVFKDIRQEWATLQQEQQEQRQLLLQQQRQQEEQEQEQEQDREERGAEIEGEEQAENIEDEDSLTADTTQPGQINVATDSETESALTEVLTDETEADAEAEANDEDVVSSSRAHNSNSDGDDADDQHASTGMAPVYFFFFIVS